MVTSLALAVSVPSYPQPIQQPFEMRVAKGLETLEDVKRNLEVLLSMQSAMQSYGGNLEESGSGFGREYHDWATFPSSEEGGQEHIISTFLTARDNSLSGFTIFVDRINIQGYSNKPSQLGIFKEYYHPAKRHYGHTKLVDISIGPDEFVNRFLSSAVAVANHLQKIRTHAFTDTDIGTLVKAMESHEAALLKSYAGAIRNKT